MVGKILPKGRKNMVGNLGGEGRKFREDRDIWRDIVGREPTDGKCTSKKIMV